MDPGSGEHAFPAVRRTRKTFVIPTGEPAGNRPSALAGRARAGGPGALPLAGQAHEGEQPIDGLLRAVGDGQNRGCRLRRKAS